MLYPGTRSASQDSLAIREMDHLIIDVKLFVPYVVQSPYDGKGFHSFPERSGWKLADNGNWRNIRVAERPFADRKEGDLDAFLQSWLFFGVLMEVFGLDTHVTLEDFIFQNNYGAWYITTKKLPIYIESWEARIKEQPFEYATHLMKAQLVLDEAYSLVSKYCSVTDPDRKPFWDINPTLALSFMILGETLCHAKCKVVQSANITMNGWLEAFTPSWGYSEKLLKLMKRDGWCPYSLRVLLGTLRGSTCGLLYAMHLSHSKELGFNHKDCTNDECRA
jgi:hypothetical protein